MVFSASGLVWALQIWDPSTVDNDPLIWSSAFMAPSAEWLAFNPWAPTLAVLCAGLYGVDRLTEDRWKPWAVMASSCFGLVFMVQELRVPGDRGGLGPDGRHRRGETRSHVRCVWLLSWLGVPC